MTVLYLCDGDGCQSKYKSCRQHLPFSCRCRHTADPSHAVNGACEAPEREPERFEEIKEGLFVERSSQKFT